MKLDEMDKERNQLHAEIQKMKEEQRDHEVKRQDNKTTRNALKEKINNIEKAMMEEKKQHEQRENRKHELEKEREKLKLTKIELIDKQNEIAALVGERNHNHH